MLAKQIAESDPQIAKPKVYEITVSARQSITYNQRLSANRSTSVQKWLGRAVVDAVIAKDQFGETKLAEDEAVVVGKQTNRRVEIRVA